MSERQEFLTIRQAAARGPLTEFRLRVLKAEGRLPGFYAGSRYYINYGKLLEMLDQMTTVAADNAG